MKPLLAQNPLELIGRTPLLKIPSLSQLSGCEIFVKCEFMNPGGSIKDRAALAMVHEAIAEGRLQKGMTIVEGTAGNTGIGLAIVAKALGFKVLVVMPKGQTPEKERLIALHGADLILVDPCPFKDPKHFYHTARSLAEANPEKYWWANQFENLANFRTHQELTGPEIWQQMNSRLDALVSAAGTGGTIAGCSVYLKQQNPQIKVILADPHGSGLHSYFKTGEFRSQGSSITEGIGIMRLVANFNQAKIDDALQVPDDELITVARFVRDHDGIVLGSSSALNAAAALRTALQMGPGRRIVTFACDLGERSYSKLWSDEYLKLQKIDPNLLSMDHLMNRYRSLPLA
ncbi:MAG: cysteine synthase A [Proteobacteria bacterium]|nr:cysteine synthase A [Pseudomonadota bacterium]